MSLGLSAGFTASYRIPPGFHGNRIAAS